MSEYQCCQEIVSVRDTYRRDGRSKSGFSLHYRQQRCRRFVKAGETHCWQHKPVGGWISRDEAERIVLNMMSPPPDRDAD